MDNTSDNFRKASFIEMTDSIKLQNNLEKLLVIMPHKITSNLTLEKLNDVIELVLDIGRVPEIRHSNGNIEKIGDEIIIDEDINYVVSHLQEFTHDNRSGIPGTLHRISAIRNRQGKVVGLTCRIGRVVTGTIACIKDICTLGKSILFLGRPGVGKTTKLREISRLVADELGKRVVIVDTSNEIAGDGDTPHPAIGSARRMQVPQPEYQKDIMIEAVENHTPEVIVVDEIGTEAEAQAARTIAERGVMLIATAHGNSLESLIKNPTLSDLVGGIQSVTLGDDEAKRRASQKTVLEREKQPTFDIVIEIIDRNTLAVYKNTSEAVDYILRGWPIRPELRKVDNSKTTISVETSLVETKPTETAEENKMNFSFSRQKYCEQNKPLKRLYLYAVSRTIVEKLIERMDFNIEITRNAEDADIVIAHKNFAKGGAKILNVAKEYRAQIFYVKTNSMAQIQKVLKDALDIRPEDFTESLENYQDATEAALDEVKLAIKQLSEGAEYIDLTPQNTRVRKLQHELIEQYGYKSTSLGNEEQRHIRIEKTF